MSEHPKNDDSFDDAIKELDSTAGSWSLTASDVDNEAADPLLGALVMLTKHYGRPYTINALRSGLPLEENRLTPPPVCPGGGESRAQCQGHRKKS